NMRSSRARWLSMHLSITRLRTRARKVRAPFGVIYWETTEPCIGGADDRQRTLRGCTRCRFPGSACDRRLWWQRQQEHEKYHADDADQHDTGRGREGIDAEIECRSKRSAQVQHRDSQGEGGRRDARYEQSVVIG